MANTYSQIHLQFVFAVQNRQCLIAEPVREEIERYITGMVQNFGHKMLSIYAMPDHIHLLTGYRPEQAIKDFMREIKSRSTDFINRKSLIKHRFSWQEGYGAFSYTKRDVPIITNYIRNQPLHHKKQTFKEEYIGLLQEFEIPFEEKYLFNWIELV